MYTLCIIQHYVTHTFGTHAVAREVQQVGEGAETKVLKLQSIASTSTCISHARIIKRVLMHVRMDGYITQLKG